MTGLSVAEIVALVGAEQPARHDAERMLRRVSAPARADAESVVFAEDAEALAAAKRSAAGLILVRKDAAEDGDARLLRVANPRYAFALCAKALAKTDGDADRHQIDMSANLHYTVEHGERLRVGPGTVIGAGVRLGDDVAIGRNVTIEDGVVIGSRVVVQSGAVLGIDGLWVCA